MSDSKKLDTSKKNQTVGVHEGRLRQLLQFLKEKEAVITVDHDIYGRSNKTRYSEGDETEYSIKDLALHIWTEEAGATDWAYYEYLKSGFDVSRKQTARGKPHPAYEKFITNIICTFKETPRMDHREEKQQLFFSGDHLKMTNLLSAFPGFRKAVKQEIEQFASILNDKAEGFPYQQLRNHTSHRCHRYKQLEKDIFQYLKDANSSELKNIRSRLAEVMSSYASRLDKLEKEGVGHEIPKDGKFMKKRLRFRKLSDPDSIDISDEKKQQLEEIGFHESYLNKKGWFNDLRLDKITFWRDNLSELAIPEWPEYFLEQILLTYFELNTVCAKIVELRNRLFDMVTYYVQYSKDGKELFTMEEILSLQDLSQKLSNYEFEANAFVDKLGSDGKLLQKSLNRLPTNFDKIAVPDRLFYSRIERLIWEYLLYRMCDSCQLNKDLMEKFHSHIHKY